MRTIEVNLYKLDELPVDKQKKIIDEHRDINIRHDDWYEFTLDDWKEKLEEIGFDVPKKNGIGFELYTQGSGVAFKSKVDVIRYLKEYDKDEQRYPRIKEHYKEGKFDISLEWDGRHTFPGAMDINITSNYDDNEQDDEDMKDLVSSALENGASVVDKVAELGDEILETAREKAREIEKDLYKEYEYLTSDESVKDTIMANEMEFE